MDIKKSLWLYENRGILQTENTQVRHKKSHPENSGWDILSIISLEVSKVSEITRCTIIVRSWRCSKDTTHQHLNSSKYTLWREVVMLSETEHFRDFWSDKYSYHDNDDPDNSISNWVDRLLFHPCHLWGSAWVLTRWWRWSHRVHQQGRSVR